MAEYIDREKLMEKFCWHCEATACGDDECFYKRTMYSIPAADVQPVKHGRWIDGDCRCVTAVCSNCNRLRLGNGAKSAMRLALYCEKCGARMDGET